MQWKWRQASTQRWGCQVHTQVQKAFPSAAVQVNWSTPQHSTQSRETGKHSISDLFLWCSVTLVGVNSSWSAAPWLSIVLVLPHWSSGPYYWLESQVFNLLRKRKKISLDLRDSQEVSNLTFCLNDGSVLNSDQVAHYFGQSSLENLQGPGEKSALCSASLLMYIKADQLKI